MTAPKDIRARGDLVASHSGSRNGRSMPRMQCHDRCHRLRGLWPRLLAAGLLVLSTSACANNAAVSTVSIDSFASASVNEQETAAYRARLAEYKKLHGAYAAQADAYWNEIAAKRRARNEKRRRHQPLALADYVLTQPPVYTGPPRPKDPFAPPAPHKEERKIPVVADFLRAAEEQFGFVPDRPANEFEFKRAYAQAAMAAGLTKAQVIGIYAFETGGHGSYDTQAGLLFDKPGAKPISPALGYNQLLSTLTVSLLAEYGHQVVATLQHKAARLQGAEQQRMEHKIAALRRMVAFARSVPPRWSEYDRVAKHTAKGMGIHAVLLDVDIGPLLQVQNLANSVHFARIKGYEGEMSAAELELLNLTGAGNGTDMLMMPQAYRRQVPTANFFVRKGYERNPVASRTKVVSGLITEIEEHIARASDNPGARELASAF